MYGFMVCAMEKHSLCTCPLYIYDECDRAKWDERGREKTVAHKNSINENQYGSKRPEIVFRCFDFNRP